jgi:hypothetical protein
MSENSKTEKIVIKPSKYEETYFEQTSRVLSVFGSKIESDSPTAYVGLAAEIYGLEFVVRHKATRNFILDIDKINEEISETQRKLLNKNPAAKAEMYDLLIKKMNRIAKEFLYLNMRKITGGLLAKA